MNSLSAKNVRSSHEQPLEDTWLIQERDSNAILPLQKLILI